MKRLSGNWIVLAVFTAVLLYLCWLIILPFVNVIIWASVLAVVSYPVYGRWRRRGRGPAVSALATTLFVVLVVVVPVSLVGVMLVNQLRAVLPGLPQRLEAQLNQMPDAPWYQFIDTKVVDLDPLRERLIDRQWIIEQAKNLTDEIAARTLGVVKGVAVVLVQILFVLFTLYYLLKDADKILPVIRDMLPLDPAQADAVITRTHEIIAASLNGVLVISALQGLLGAIAFWVLGIPSAVLWGVVMFLLSMIPMAGAAIVWVPAALYLFGTGHYIKGIILVIWGGGVIGMIDNLLRPRLVGERTRLHELVVFFSVLGGLQVFGVLGLVVGPVVVAVAYAIFELFRRMEWGTPAPAAVVVPVPIVKPEPTLSPVSTPAGPIGQIPPP